MEGIAGVCRETQQVWCLGLRDGGDFGKALSQVKNGPLPVTLSVGHPLPIPQE